ncbi:transcriptional repressor [Rhizophlyctis rosea]|uniref:Transcriptional repressor n=1 Tax=Rhizophlyctis rosea TaxID=64517 RepID=A0AAD5S7Y3_9FUNG|nr:transcriptional repressor [Rhizophlyctis rosea]
MSSAYFSTTSVEYPQTSTSNDMPSVHEQGTKSGSFRHLGYPAYNPYNLTHPVVSQSTQAQETPVYQYHSPKEFQQQYSWPTPTSPGGSPYPTPPGTPVCHIANYSFYPVDDEFFGESLTPDLPVLQSRYQSLPVVSHIDPVPLHPHHLPFNLETAPPLCTCTKPPPASLLSPPVAGIDPTVFDTREIIGMCSKSLDFAKPFICASPHVLEPDVRLTTSPIYPHTHWAVQHYGQLLQEGQNWSSADDVFLQHAPLLSMSEHVVDALSFAAVEEQQESRSQDQGKGKGKEVEVIMVDEDETEGEEEIPAAVESLVKMSKDPSGFPMYRSEEPKRIDEDLEMTMYVEADDPPPDVTMGSPVAKSSCSVGDTPSPNMPLRQAAALFARQQQQNAAMQEALSPDTINGMSTSASSTNESESSSVQTPSLPEHDGPSSVTEPVLQRRARRGRRPATKQTRYRLSSPDGSDTPMPRKRKRTVKSTSDTEAPTKSRAKRAARTTKAGKCRKRHQCGWPDCGKTFATAGHLSRHTRIHVGVKPFLCPFEGCESAFARQDNMRQHHKTHYKNTNMSPPPIPVSRRKRIIDPRFIVGGAIEGSASSPSHSATGSTSSTPTRRQPKRNKKKREVIEYTSSSESDDEDKKVPHPKMSYPYHFHNENRPDLTPEDFEEVGFLGYDQLPTTAPPRKVAQGSSSGLSDDDDGASGTSSDSQGTSSSSDEGERLDPKDDNRLLYIDANSYSHKWFGLSRDGLRRELLSFWEHLKIATAVQSLVDAAGKSGYMLKAFAHGIKHRPNAIARWKQKREEEIDLGKRDLPQGVVVLVQDAFRKCGVDFVHSLAADMDDTLAAEAHRDRAAILSPSNAFFLYQNVDFDVSEDYTIKNDGKLALQPRPKLELRPYTRKRFLLRPTPATTDHDPELASLEECTYMRGVPSPSARILGNLHIPARPLRLALVVWEIENVLADDSWDNYLGKPEEAVVRLFGDLARERLEGITDLSWQNHLFAMHAVVSEICLWGGGLDSTTMTELLDKGQEGGEGGYLSAA